MAKGPYRELSVRSLKNCGCRFHGRASNSLANLASLGLALRLGDLTQTGGGLTPAFVTWLFVVLVRAGFFKNSAFHGLLLETSQGGVNAFSRLHNHLCQMFMILSFAVRQSQAASATEFVMDSIPQELHYTGQYLRQFCRAYGHMT